MTVHKKISIILLIIALTMVLAMAQEPIKFQMPADSGGVPASANGAVAKPSVYEAFLDSVKLIANSILPEKAKFDALKEAANAETAAPKDEYEKQADYEKRLAGFEKTRQQKISGIENEYQAKIKGSLDKLRTGINGKQDLQPDWAGMLKREGTTEEYKERQSKFTEKISKMKAEISQINELLSKLDFNSGETKTLMNNWQKKNQLYINRLEKACELMQDYALQEEAKILTTEKKKTEMVLGSYDPEKEEFELAMNDTDSKTAPFDYAGKIKILPAQAREINRQTDNFTASVDYINYPFIVEGSKLYLGMAKAHVFYKDNEILTSGAFKNVQNYEKLDGYADWAAHADSIIKGNLAPKKLDSLYAMHIKIETNIASKDDSPQKSRDFWTGKNVLRVLAFGFSATSLGIGLAQNEKVSSKTNTARKLYDEARLAKSEQKDELFFQMKTAYESSVNSVFDSKDSRNRFYAGAGVFGLVGVASFFF